MKLRARLALTTVLVTVPLLAVMTWLYARLAEQATEDAAAQAIIDIMQSGGREECEASPATWSPRPPGMPPSANPPVRPPRMRAFFAYDAALVAADPHAPPIADELRTAIERGASSATRHVTFGPRPATEILVRMPWSSGPCRFVLARRPTLFEQSSIPLVRIWVPIVIVVLVAVLVAIGPAIRRIRRLTGEVSKTALDGYQPEITVRGGDEIGALARAFGDAGREIRERMEAQERRERSLREFLDNTTHDVMTPLTVLQGHLTAIAERAETPELRARANAAKNEAHYMASLVQNLSLAAKLEAGEPDLAIERIDLNALVDRVVARHAPIARMRAIALEHATPDPRLFVRGDVTLVEQAVSNLVLNAVQHVEAGGHVAVVLDRVETTRFAIRVIDDGPGMAAGDLERVVERGLRGNDARTRAPAGRGLGLDIVQRVLRIHEWTLAIANADPRGLSVVVGGPAEHR